MVVAMRRGAFLFVALMLAVALSTQTLARPRAQLVYRIDSVSAAIVDGKLVVDVSGAVNSGGWKRARLRVKPSAPEAHVLEMDFIADPPSPKHVVIQELLPVQVQLKLGLPKYGTVAVSATSQTNSITAEIRFHPAN
jgi:hypothetical protein